jgi:DNA-binding transcriptional regulator YhcF (GntR family)
VLTTQQGIGTFVTQQVVKPDEAARQKRLSQLAAECAAKAGAEGFTLAELIERMQEIG